MIKAVVSFDYLVKAMARLRRRSATITNYYYYYYYGCNVSNV